MWKEFKQFAMKGNVLDLAIGVIIGGAFSKIVSSLVNDIIMPIIGLIVGGVNFTNLKLVISGLNKSKPLTLNYGQFIQNILDFLIIAFSIFLFVKLISKFKVNKENIEKKPEEPIISKEEALLIDIRDILRNMK